MSVEVVTEAELDQDITNRPVAAAMVLLAEAEVVAGAIRSGADHYARQREAEADLLVQKARRVLEAAEAKAAVILATARSRAHEGDTTIDLDQLATQQGGAEADGETELDRMLGAAIGRAINTALLPDVDA